MFRDLMQGPRRTLVHDAVDEIVRMLERGHSMFQTSCRSLLDGAPPPDGLPDDVDLNMGERLVRRMVVQHLVVDPQRDLATSVALLSVVHDVERIGDYAKSLVELSSLATADPSNSMADDCRRLHALVEPGFEGTLRALRDSDEEAARRVMQDHVKVKQITDGMLKAAITEQAGGTQAALFAVASRYLRRVSGHLSNVASAVINPVDQVSGKELT